MLYILTDARTPALQMAASHVKEAGIANLTVHYAGYRSFVAPLQEVRGAIKKGDRLLITVPFVEKEELAKALNPLKKIDNKKIPIAWCHPGDAKDIAALAAELSPEARIWPNDFYKKDHQDTCPVTRFVEYRTSHMFMGFSPADDVLKKIIEVLRDDPEASRITADERKRIDRFAEKKPTLAGSSEAVEARRRQVVQLAVTDLSVLIHGETGTGKEAAAYYLHEFSSRADKPFVEVNCASLGGDFLESELFGHKKGAFTGAIRDRKGLVATAAGGTLFLDELPEMSPLVQAKLLRFLETGEYRPLGADQNVKADVRVIAAGQPNLIEENLRNDLKHRLAVGEVHLPTLNEQQHDILTIARNLAARLEGRPSSRCREEKIEQRKVSRQDIKEAWDYFKDGEKVLQEYDWSKGNVRELYNYVQRHVLLGHDVLEEMRRKTAENASGKSSQEATAAPPFQEGLAEQVETGTDRWWAELIEKIKSLKIDNLDDIQKKREDFQELEAVYMDHVYQSLKGSHKLTDVLGEGGLECAQGTYNSRMALLKKKKKMQGEKVDAVSGDERGPSAQGGAAVKRKVR